MSEEDEQKQNMFKQEEKNVMCAIDLQASTA